MKSKFTIWHKWCITCHHDKAVNRQSSIIPYVLTAMLQDMWKSLVTGTGLETLYLIFHISCANKTDTVQPNAQDINPSIWMNMQKSRCLSDMFKSKSCRIWVFQVYTTGKPEFPGGHQARPLGKV
jgi:hypothetical protein